MTDESPDRRRALAALERIDAAVARGLRTREGHATLIATHASDWRALRPFLLRGLEPAETTPPPAGTAETTGEQA